MGIKTIILYIIFTFILGIILKILENKKQDNFYDYIIISNIYIFILSGIFKNYKITCTNIFLIPLFQIILTIIFIISIKEISIIRNNNYNLKKYFLTIITTYLLNVIFINKLDTMFLTINEMKIILWLIIIVYLFSLLKINLKTIKNDQIFYYQDNEYIVMQYAKFKNKYYNEINLKEKKLVPLIYSIMIYENYHNPSIFRFLDKYKNLISKKQLKYGIMQIESNEYITDIESIKITIKKLEKLAKNNIKIEKIINEYYKYDNIEVLSIYNKIEEFNKK